ncbi:MAG: site-specific integrase [Caenispirillum bisanense]|nr:site-specific integrase [Caenispirillum bisanense]MCA1971262.1 site-specific integrase [Caenispirillum sp.]
MARLLDGWIGRSVSDITKATCQEYTTNRREAGVKDGTIRRELSVLSAALGHARDAERLKERPKVWMPPPGAGKERWLTRQEAARLLRAAHAEPQARAHLPLFIMLGLYGGARKSAILGLRWPQVDLNAARIDWRDPTQRQTNKRRSKIPIPRRLLTFLRLARRRGSDLGYVVNIGGERIGDVKKAFASACERAKLEGVTPHTLRHTCGTWLAQKGVPMWEIAGFLGHTVQRTTELYAHHHPDYMETARDALDGIL